MSSFRGVRRTAVQMPMLRGSRGGFVGFRSTRCGKSNACWLGRQRCPSCSLDDHYVQYSAKRGLQRGLRTPQVFWLGKEVYDVLDSVVRALEFKFLALLLTIKPVIPIFALKQTSCLPFNS